MSYNYRKHSTIHRSDGVVKIDGLLGQNTEFGWIVSGCIKRYKINFSYYYGSTRPREVLRSGKW